MNRRSLINVYSNHAGKSALMAALEQIDGAECILYDFREDISKGRNDLIILEIIDETEKSREVIDKLINTKSDAIIVLHTENALLVSTLVKAGFRNIYIFPFEIVKFISFVKDLIKERGSKFSNDNKDDNHIPSLDNLIGKSEVFTKVIELSKKSAVKRDLDILITGETGTGKGVLAKAIHEYGAGKSSPFIDIMCTAIPPNLLESELFGHEPGAFTSAHSRKIGLFELAEGGTIFLDEIGDLRLDIQAKLLRTIEKKSIRRIGGILDIPINTRIISATNKNLVHSVKHDLFRKDLYYRLNVMPIEIPPLKDRGDDVLLLSDYFLKQFNKLFDKKIGSIDAKLSEYFVNYDWPGNVRELRNMLERSVLLSETEILTHEDIKLNSKEENPVNSNKNFNKFELDLQNTTIKLLNKLYAKEVLKRNNNNKLKTARILGISRPSLDALLK